MIAFFEAEADRRGLNRADYEAYGKEPAVFASQYYFEPDACANGEGVAADGTVTWSGGRARYLYVLEADAENPGVPPNLDQPDGALWKIDTIPPAVPPRTGEVRYGEVPAGTEQDFPATGAPTPLVSGQTYYLYAMADIAVPVTWCLFVAE